MRAICGLFSSPDAKPVGRVIAVVGAKGGVGASTIAHNIAWAIASDLQLDTVVADLDLGFGTAGLDYNQDPPQGIADAVFSPDRIDTAFIDRLLSKCTDHLSLLAAPATLDRVYDFSPEAFDSIFDSLRATVPCIVLDVPHQWTRLDQAHADRRRRHPDRRGARSRQPAQCQEPARSAARGAPERQASVLLPQSGRRAEAAGDQAGDFAKALEDEPVAIIPFEPQVFGTAANNGQMIAELSASHRTAETFRQLAQVLTGRAETKKTRSSLLPPIIGKLLRQA